MKMALPHQSITFIISLLALATSFLTLFFFLQTQDPWTVAHRECVQEYSNIRADMAEMEKTNPQEALTQGQELGVLDNRGRLVSDDAWIDGCIDERMPVYP
jgi:hypothetical protein